MNLYVKTLIIRRLYNNALPLLAIFLVIAVSSFANCVGQNDSLFRLANKYYQDNEFNKAVSTYQKIINKGNQTPELLYNLGNAYFKSGKLSYAILYYEKAKLLSPHDEDINQNLAIANARVVDKIDIIPDFFINRWLKNLINVFPSNTWAIISIITFGIMLTLFLLFFFSGSRNGKKVAFYSAVLLLVISLLTYWFSVERKQYITRNNTAVVVDPSIAIKSSPDTEGNNVFILHEGTKVMIIDSINDWKEIKLSDGNKGWIESKSIEPI
ncbi:MAG: tetratricopeptide repeat protein [Bacteroidales bacterium]|nr:tetratricopeptide repeat protein [Bacteroidales bacterium]